MAVYDQNTIVTIGDVGYGAAISVAIFLIISLFVVIYTTALEWRNVEMSIAASRPSRTGER